MIETTVFQVDRHKQYYLMKKHQNYVLSRKYHKNIKQTQGIAYDTSAYFNRYSNFTFFYLLIINFTSIRHLSNNKMYVIQLQQMP